MFLRFTKVKRGSAVLEYASIAERLVEDRKQKTSTLKYLGPVKSDEDRERYRKIFDEYREAMRKFSPDDLKIRPTFSFGLFYASRTIMERNGILKIPERHTRSDSRILSFMIILSTPVDSFHFHNRQHKEGPELPGCRPGQCGKERSVHFIGEQGSFRYSEKPRIAISQNP
ncbi:MAG: hypothetical protein M1393_07130 [Candidatus Thermoplasmatota archaeon]|nr:hypothetical protein [Candidatus Thermoplasmatota archaeon]